MLPIAGPSEGKLTARKPHPGLGLRSVDSLSRRQVGGAQNFASGVATIIFSGVHAAQQNVEAGELYECRIRI